MKSSLDLGCGNYPKNPFNAENVFGVDIDHHSNSNISTADLVIEKIPFEDSSFDYVTAYDFLEHIPRLIYYREKRIQPFIEIMNEIWRVLKPNGIFKAHTPAFPREEAFVDPTHVNFISMDTAKYFCGEEYTSLSKTYGFYGEFSAKSIRWDCEHELNPTKCHIIWEMVAKK
jgi:SAM-dependent methyltransferase